MRSIHFGFIKILILSAITFLITTSCDVNDPKKDNPKPEGYQEDIPWPSLADSPWPTIFGNPLGNNRSKYTGPSNGIIEWTQDSVFLQSGITIGNSNLIYGMSQYPITKAFCLNVSNGKFIWQNSSFGNDYTEINQCPILLHDGTVIVSSGTYGQIHCLYPDGKIKWSFDPQTKIWNRGWAVNKSGTLFFTDIKTNTINALNNKGTLEWSIPLNYRLNPIAVLVFSPDGKTVYIQGMDVSLIAFDIETKSVKWTFGNEWLNSFPLVDSQGHIYILTKDINSNNKHSLYSLNPDGTIHWAYEHNNRFFTESDFTLSMDYEGTTYFAFDSLYAIDYSGNLKWRKPLNSFSTGVLLTDKNCDIYLITVYGENGVLFSKFKKNGDKVLESTLLVDGNPYFGAITSDGKMIVSSWRYAEKDWIYCIK
ncbi:MAG: hypothetical protein Fur0015_09670 [Ignavibacteriales bacterium]